MEDTLILVLEAKSGDHTMQQVKLIKYLGPVIHDGKKKREIFVILRFQVGWVNWGASSVVCDTKVH